MMGDTIVVVDDEQSICDVVRDLLEDEGYRVVTVADPAVIGPSLAGHAPDLFLIDIMLPHMSGMELAAALRMAGYPTTPMVAMSASGFFIRVASRSGCFITVIEKPFDLDTLLECIEQHLA